MTPNPPALPARVQSVIARQQRESEKLVALAQLVLVILLSLLYAFSPAGYAPDSPIKAAPLGLSLFAILVMLRLYCARTDQLGNGLIALFTVAEMAVLIGTLWAYHLQFEQPAAIGLKNSAFLYIFLLLALRALRFEPRWVLLSGITAALCWGALVWHAFRTAPHNLITWDYVTYATTGQIHLGSVFDQIAAILAVSTLLALSLRRARALLEQATVQAQAANDLAQFFDSGVAARITASEESAMAGQGELRRAAIIFTDMRGFTNAATHMAPDALIGLLGEYQRLIVPIVQVHGGAIDKFMGDGILASFGTVTPSETYAADAFRAMDAIMQASHRWHETRRREGNIAPIVGGGLAVGDVVFGIIGGGKRLEYTVIGDAVNLAAKLEKHNKAERTQALSTRDALERAAAQGYARKGAMHVLAAREVGGVNQPLDLVAWPLQDEA